MPIPDDHLLFDSKQLSENNKMNNFCSYHLKEIKISKFLLKSLFFSPDKKKKICDVSVEMQHLGVSSASICKISN